MMIVKDMIDHGAGDLDEHNDAQQPPPAMNISIESISQDLFHDGPTDGGRG